MWKKITGYQQRRIGNFIRDSRRETTLWEMLEEVTNNTCQYISIEGRKGHISIALDDNKI